MKKQLCWNRSQRLLFGAGGHHPPSPSVSELHAASAVELIAGARALIHCNNSENLRKTDSWGIAFLPKAVLFNDASGHVPIARDQNPSLHGEPGAIQGDLSTHLWLHVALPAPLVAVSASKASCTFSLDWNCCTSFLASSTNSCGKTCLTNSM